jgi:hypothetical protein
MAQSITFQYFFFCPVPDAHSCKELHLRSHRYALQNFQQVVGTEEFLLLGFNEVINYRLSLWFDYLVFFLLVIQ